VCILFCTVYFVKKCFCRKIMFKFKTLFSETLLKLRLKIDCPLNKNFKSVYFRYSTKKRNKNKTNKQKNQSTNGFLCVFHNSSCQHGPLSSISAFCSATTSLRPSLYRSQSEGRIARNIQSSTHDRRLDGERKVHVLRNVGSLHGPTRVHVHA